VAVVILLLPLHNVTTNELVNITLSLYENTLRLVYFTTGNNTDSVEFCHIRIMMKLTEIKLK